MRDEMNPLRLWEMGDPTLDFPTLYNKASGVSVGNLSLQSVYSMERANLNTNGVIYSQLPSKQ